MQVLTALISLAAGVLALILRLRELRQGRDPKALREKATDGHVLDSSGRPVERRFVAKPSMLVPALGLATLLQIMAVVATVFASVAIFETIETPPSILETHDLLILHREEIGNAEEALYFGTLDSTATYDKTKHALQSYLNDVMNLTTGFIIIAIAWPLVIIFGYSRSFVFANECFGRAVAMGAWLGLFMGSFEFIAYLLIGKTLLEATGAFSLKFIIFLAMGLLTGLAYLLIRKLRATPFFRRWFLGESTPAAV